MGKMVTMNMLDKKPSNAMHLSLEQAAVQKNLTELLMRMMAGRLPNACLNLKEP